MSKTLRLSVVDQSPVRAGGTGADALRETIQLAVLAESLGYHRYWVSEHHNSPEFAATSPAIMTGQIAAKTSTLRVGSGGVLLSNYSALHVAESFRVLESLYPGRIDLGLGRSPGGDRRVVAALASSEREGRHYAEKLDDLVGFLTGNLSLASPFAGIAAGPIGDQIPDIWLLGSGTASAEIAAQRGLALSLVHFLSDTNHGGPGIIAQYRRSFRPSPFLAEPRVNVAVSVLCAESKTIAEYLAWSLWFMRVRSARGQSGPIENPDYARANISANEMKYVNQSRQSDIVGDPSYVRGCLEHIAALYNVDDLSIITICHDFAARARSYELVAQACGIRADS